MYLVDCRSAKCLAVLHKIYIPVLVLMMLIKEKSPSAPALLAAKVVIIVTKTLKPGYCPASTA